MRCAFVLANSCCRCFFSCSCFLCLRCVSSFGVLFVPACKCFSTGSFDALVFLLSKVPELRKLVKSLGGGWTEHSEFWQAACSWKHRTPTPLEFLDFLRSNMIAKSLLHLIATCRHCPQRTVRGKRRHFQRTNYWENLVMPPPGTSGKIPCKEADAKVQ